MILAVFDTNVYFQASVRRGGPADACWQLAVSGRVKVFSSDDILKEVGNVLSRPKLRAQFATLTDETSSVLLAGFRSNTTIVNDIEEHFSLPRDPDDEKFINLAIQVGAEYLVTRDLDLLDLHNDSAFCTAFPRLNIVTPVGFLETVRSS